MVNPVAGGITAALGFRAAGVRCGLRRPGDERPDLAVVAADGPCAAAGLFTTNRVQAAPVRVSREHLGHGRARAIVANAGCANACTGAGGLADARRMAAAAAAALGCRPEEVLVASTGVIGTRLPLEAVLDGIAAACARLGPHGGDAALAITTTDTRPKEAARRFFLEGRAVTVGGMAKGAGMIRPRLATMLAFLTTDAAVEAGALRKALTAAVNRSFNMVTVDGDTSTNDTILLLASGRSGAGLLEEGTDAYRLFCQALEEVCVELARAIARDGEGATRLLEVAVTGARSEEEARRAALAVAGSNLVKTAVAGADPNWGRVLAALGYSDAVFDPDRVSLFLGPVKLVEGGCEAPFDEGLARTLLSQPEVRLAVDLGAGWGRATAWGCDLTCEYVRINGSYRS